MIWVRALLYASERPAPEDCLGLAVRGFLAAAVDLLLLSEPPRLPLRSEVAPIMVSSAFTGSSLERNSASAKRLQTVRDSAQDVQSVPSDRASTRCRRLLDKPA